MVSEKRYNPNKTSKKLELAESNAYQYKKGLEVKRVNKRYNAYNSQTSKIEPVVTRTYTYTYNKKGLMTILKDSLNSEKIKYYYNKAGQKTKTEIYVNGKLRHKQTFTYKKKKLVKSVDYYDGNKCFEYTYYSNGNVKKRITYNSDGTVSDYIQYDKYENETGQVIYDYTEDGTQIVWFNGTRANYYTKDGTLKKYVENENWVKDKEKDVTAVSYYTSGYRKGQIKTSTTKNYKDSKWTTPVVYIYLYTKDKTGKNVKTKLCKNKATNEIISKTVYTWKKK